MESFKTNIKDFSVHWLREHLLGEHTIADVDINLIECDVFWKADFDFNESRMHGISVYVQNIKGEFEWSFVEDELTHEEFDLIISKGGTVDGTNVVGKIKFDSTDWQINSSLEVEYRGYCAPYEVELDFNTKTINVN